jgi:ATP phosphoribosyltransferase regulatory subunit
VLHARPATPSATREPIQIGAEIFGHAGIQSDLEIQSLLCQSLKSAGVRGARMDVGHVAVFRALVQAAAIGHEQEVELFEALQKKDVPAVKELTRKLDGKTRAAMLLLPELYGGVEVLALARKKLPENKTIKGALDTLVALGKACPIPVSFDLAELRGYHYHSGVVFDAYCDGVTGPVARGGRYDEVGKAFGRLRPATGFSIELRELAASVTSKKKARRK